MPTCSSLICQCNLVTVLVADWVVDQVESHKAQRRTELQRCDRTIQHLHDTIREQQRHRGSEVGVIMHIAHCVCLTYQLSWLE